MTQPAPEAGQGTIEPRLGALVAHGVAVQAQVELAQGNLAAAIRWTEASGLCAQDELSYSREREYLTFVRVRIAQGREYPRGLYLSEGLSLLEGIAQDAEAKMRTRSVLEVLLLRALALQAQGDYAMIEVSEKAVTRRKRSWFSRDEISVSIGKVASVHIKTGIIWSDILIESSGGSDPLKSHGHTKGDARRIKELIEDPESLLLEG